MRAGDGDEDDGNYEDDVKDDDEVDGDDGNYEDDVNENAGNDEDDVNENAGNDEDVGDANCEQVIWETAELPVNLCLPAANHPTTDSEENTPRTNTKYKEVHNTNTKNWIQIQI